MELKEGMYVRTLNGKLWIIKSQRAISGHKKDIINASYNIIDLIEVGDYVNGLKVQKVNNEIKGFGTIVFDKDTSIFEDYIYSIVTKEQFESMSYKVGD